MAQVNIVLEDGHYFDGSDMVEFSEIVLKDSLIHVISHRAGSKTEVEGIRISVRDKYVIPGLIDAHVHLCGSPVTSYVNVPPLLNAHTSLRCGVTTVMDLFMFEDYPKRFQSKVSNNKRYFSRILASGPMLTVPDGHGTEFGIFTRTISSVAAAHEITEITVRRGVDVIKIAYQRQSTEHSLTKEMVEAICKTAQKYNKKVVAHVDFASEAMDCIRAGVDGLAHIPLDLITEDELQEIKRANVLVIPTLSVFEAVFDGPENLGLQDSLLYAVVNSKYVNQLSKLKREFELKINNSEIDKYRYSYKQNFSNLIKYGIPVIAGTDAGNFAVFWGFALHNELSLYADLGMDRASVINCATQNIRYLFPDLKIGRIAKGYIADLLVLNSNPLEQISATKDIHKVIRNGKVMEEIHQTQHMSVKLDTSIFDFDKMKRLPDGISEYSDRLLQGDSKAYVGLVTASEDIAANKALSLTGKVVVKGYAYYSGVSIEFNDFGTPVDLSDYTALEFNCRGNGETYYVKLNSSLIDDFNYHRFPFKTGPEWNKIVAKFSDFEQSFFGKRVDLDLSSIVSLAFEASGRTYKDVNLQIDSIRFVQKR